MRPSKLQVIAFHMASTFLVLLRDYKDPIEAIRTTALIVLLMFFSGLFYGWAD